VARVRRAFDDQGRTAGEGFSESETLEQVMRLLEGVAGARVQKARNLIASLQLQLSRGKHVNPALEDGDDFDDEDGDEELDDEELDEDEGDEEDEDDDDCDDEEEGGILQSERVEAIDYIHAADGKPYRHVFDPGVTMVLHEDDGTVELFRPDGKPLHALFEVA
jgi:hypothetical protein